jgi:hypothetical protein
MALGSLYVVSYDSQGYGGGIVTLPVYVLQEQDSPSKVKVKVKCRRHVLSVASRKYKNVNAGSHSQTADKRDIVTKHRSAI